MTFLNVFRKVGGAFDIHDDGIRFCHPGGDLKPVVLETDVHPGFMTDWQQPLIVALTQAEGCSIVHETVYENRFGFTEALVEMGANISRHREGLGGLDRAGSAQRNFEHSAVISGPTPLHGADIEVPDLRGGFSHLIAALTAEGHVHRARHRHHRPRLRALHRQAHRSRRRFQPPVIDPAPHARPGRPVTAHADR